MASNLVLQSRLQNCLNTIFEMEAMLEEAGSVEFMRTEFSDLKKATEQIELASVNETDVELIEKATERLLNELYLVGTQTKRDFPRNWIIQ